MKKLMIALGIATMAVAAQAATFKWTTEDKAWGPNVVDFTKITPGHYAVGDDSTALKDLISTYAMTVTWDLGISADGGEMIHSQGTSLAFSSGKISQKNVSNAAFEPVTSDATVTYSWEAVVTASWKDESGATWTMTSDTISGSAPYTKDSDYTVFETGTIEGWTITKSGGPEPTPEPTSGLLLLLGVAGLALRRKQK